VGYIFKLEKPVKYPLNSMKELEDDDNGFQLSIFYFQMTMDSILFVKHLSIASAMIFYFVD
jgi:hypothetical protein